MPVWTPQHIPTYAQGFARSAAESANPGLWKELVGLWLPALGPTGLTLRDVSGHNGHTSLTGGDWGNFDRWGITSRGYAVRFNPDGEAGGYAVTIPETMNSQGVSEWTLIINTNVMSTAVSREWWQELSGEFWQNYIVFSGSTNTLIWYTRDTSTGLTGIRNNDLNLSLADPFVGSLAFVYSPARSFKGIYFNGELLGSTSTSIDPFNSSWTESVGDFGEDLNGDCTQVARYNRALVSNEIQQLYVDPYAIVRQRARVYPAAAAPAGGTTNPFSMGAVNLFQGKLAG